MIKGPLYEELVLPDPEKHNGGCHLLGHRDHFTSFDKHQFVVVISDIVQETWFIWACYTVS